MMPLLLFLLGCAAIYVGTVQAAFSMLMRLSLRLMAEHGGRNDVLGRYLDEPIQLFLPARVLLAIIVVLASVVLVRLVGGTSIRALSLVLLSMVVFVIVCEHLVPLLIARRNPEAVLEFLLPSFTVVAGILQPVRLALLQVLPFRDRSTDSAAGPETAAGDEPAVTRERGADSGLREREQHRLLRSIFDFGDTLAREVMTPRPDIVAIPVEATLDELRALFREQEYSRIPAFRENLDNIAGVVFVKDLIQITELGGEQRPITTIMRPAYFVPETKLVPELLKEFQLRQVQLAIVVDEYGGTAGLVTLEDLLEEIVGEIRDEYDVETEVVIDEGNASFIMSGKASIDEIRERLGIDIEQEGFETVGGFLLARLGRVPTVGEMLDIDGLQIEVLDAERRRVTRVRIRRQPVPESAGEGR